MTEDVAYVRGSSWRERKVLTNPNSHNIYQPIKYFGRSRDCAQYLAAKLPLSKSPHFPAGRLQF